jgi:mRNA-degrading endonuclease RelE of RelBE toxin-antitoxin system/energy-coupling factor transporter ATP-binding protein EcfA2
MIEGARQLPVHHLTIRVPWHDNGWQGTFCNNPCANTSCTILPRIATNRDDADEMAHAGKSIEGLSREQLPSCVDEHCTIMAPFSLSMVKNHPYANNAKITHGHFEDTPYTIRPYSAAAVPFRWMLREQIEGNHKWNIQSKAEQLQLDYQAEREPDLTLNRGWAIDKKTWIQEGINQRVILDTFFSASKPNQSLVFFYAKRTPLIEDARRVIVGVGRVKTVGAPTEYRYKSGTCPSGKMCGYLWERNIEHSIRPDGDDGFLLPYQELLALAEHDAGLDLRGCTAFAPDEYHAQYSYGSELLPPDGAIASLLALEKAVKQMRNLLIAPWSDYLKWIDRELNRLWRARGAFPGLGAALHAFGLPQGNLLAWNLIGDTEIPVDPWPRLTNALKNPASLPDYLRDGIGKTQQKKWEKLPKERRALLMLLARFNLTNDQAIRWYQETEREKAGIKFRDKEILSNPYQIYETDRLQPDPISFSVIDRGMFPPDSLRNSYPVPEPSHVHESIDERRVRAIMIQTLEESADDGHTLLPSSWLIQSVRERPMKPDCPLDVDTISVVEDYLSPYIHTLDIGEIGSAFQLDRFKETSALIRTAINKRRKGKPNAGDFDWLSLVNYAIDGDTKKTAISEDDKKARQEKSAALKVLFRSRVSVLMGSAGTGKSTLLKALCAIEPVVNGGVLLLAPTGKARVRLEQTSAMVGKGKTVAQFLYGLQRYDGDTGRYYVNTDAPRSSAHKTVVIDECSMLTEEQLAALLDALKGVTRLILVGDPKQLPPIGAGRPYVDIVQTLKPENIDSMFPRVASCFAELTVTMRQKGESGEVRTDVLMADAFSGRALDAGADEVWHTVAAKKTSFVKLVRWNEPDQLQKLLLDELVVELDLASVNDEVGFELSIGGVPSVFNGQTNVFFNTRYKDRDGAAEKVESWQILSPVRQTEVGVLALNRVIQQRFRKRFLDLAVRTGFQKKIITSPAGPEGIIYGDKVINVVNSSRRKVYPDKDDHYVANGDIGVVTGHRRTKRKDWKPVEIEVELASQPGYAYKYWPGEFDGQESTPPLELAYALTVHKTQGSEFGATFLVVPNPCRLLTREMLYTALTRHKDKVVIFHQGDFRDLYRYSLEQESEITKRMTNLFKTSFPIEILVNNRSVFLDKNLIYRTEHGELVRSKSEWIIADKLHAAGIDYQYEQPLLLDGVERFPDFTIADDDAGITWYWEHNGMLSNKDYRHRWERKLDAYRRQGILPLSEGGGENGTLLTTEEREGAGLSADQIKANIEAILGEEMNFRIADSFTDSLSKLNNDEQKAVKTTAFDLQLNPANPGMQFHRLENSKDPNFWSIRVNRDIRLIVHKTDSNLLLCYVDHHDNAYKWAERRKLETHPKTGAAQLVKIRETVKKITVTKYAVDDRKPLLFDRVAEETLLGFGVPPEWLDDVMKADEDSLLELADYLPGEAAEALLELATGNSPQPASTAIHFTSPFDHPDALRRFRQMENVEELQRALDYPWEKWTIFLHPDQRDLVERKYNGPARISGSAGTGKTIVALHRAVYLARENPESRVLLTTFSDTLAKSLKIKLRRLIHNEPRIGERVEVYDLNGIGKRLYELNLGSPNIPSHDVIEKILVSASAKAETHKFNQRFLISEWEQIVDAWQLESWDSYRDVIRLGRKTRLPEKQRAILWSIFEKVRSELKKKGFVTLSEMYNRLAIHFSGHKSYPFEYIVVDESQDIGIAQLRFLAALGAGRADSLFFAGDLGQRIFQKPFSWKALGVDIRGRSRTLRINYRTSHQIRNQADLLLAGELTDVDGNTEKRKGTISLFNGPKPAISIFGTQQEESNSVGQWIEDRMKEGVTPQEFGVFVRSEGELDRACKAIERAGKAYRILDDKVSTNTDCISLSTTHLAKGLEFRAVVVMACDDEIIPSQERIETAGDDSDLEEVYNTERHLLYVACTRARDHLLVTGVDPASEFIDDLK